MSPQALLKHATNTENDARVAPYCGRPLLNADGTVASCDTQAQQLFCASERALVGLHISELIPRLVSEPGNEWLSAKTMFLCHCDIPFRALRINGGPFVSALYFNPLAGDPAGKILLLVREVNAWPPRMRLSTEPDNHLWCLE